MPLSSSSQFAPGPWGAYKEIASQFPNATAIIDDTTGLVLSYDGLTDAAMKLGKRITDTFATVPGEPVGIMMDRCVGQIISQLAILYISGSCVPIDPSLHVQTREAMLDRLGIRCVLTVDEKSMQVNLREPPTIFSAQGAHSSTENCSHILHTSGSTGAPKAIRLPGKGVLRHAGNSLFPLKPGDFIAHLCSPFFDISILEVWSALLSGATVVVFSPDKVRDPLGMDSSFKCRNIHVSFMPTALFNAIAIAKPTAFSTLRKIVIGGEPANAAAIERVLRVSPSSFALYNAYGPTECSVLVLVHKVSLEEALSGRIAIGTPYDPTTTVRVISSRGVDVNGVEKGELYLASSGLAIDYWKMDDLNAEKFVWQDGRRWYKTGDEVWWRDGKVGGILEYAGRQDNQVKLRGYRFELEEVEVAILASGLADAAVAFVLRPVETAPLLIACVVPKSGMRATSKQIQHHLGTRLPVYMVPRIRLCDSLPLTRTGKVDRRALEATYMTAVHKCTALHEASAADPVALMKSIWQATLAIPFDIGIDDDFFDLGGNSISASSVLHRYRRASGNEIPVHAIYQHPTIRGLVSADQIRNISMTETLLRDSRLADDICPQVTTNYRTEAKHVFLTGATGFLGAYVLNDLLKIRSVDTVICLVRAPSDAIARLRIQHALERYDLWNACSPVASKISAFAGSLQDEQFGLSTEAYNKALNTDIIYHLGAQVKYIEPYSAHRPANVIGTLNVIRLAALGRSKTLHYVSSISSYGPVGMTHPNLYLPEDAPLLPHVRDLDHDIGYAQSQWVAEEMVRRAMGRGIPASVYRPGHILGDYHRGIGNNDDFVARLVHGCKMIGACPRLPDQSKFFIPVDHCSAMLLRLSHNPEALGGCYNLIPPAGMQPDQVDVAKFFAILRSLGLKMEELPYKEWVERLENSSGNNTLLPLLPVLKAPTTEGSSFWELYEHVPTYETLKTERALRGGPGHLLFPDLDEAYFGRCLRVWAQLWR
ncbi:hypothetical protein PC9H_008781 [Pleurotus ostreatus]|uniref:Carrier domain-containing protein n=2 Tax=Pleurotus TaxID=5320 RepID=A0A8H6ZPF7_PLEOS|nr:uncharacterized protein PC9H_008781 [Pleurotus ostreatus]KAF7426413.1 hypothetical protein PC9H_008781 [Pleurotus ostreatus]KAG9221847.1 hypothetical protein CCMSSC00406_0005672 [Pleurotus cornucopiae]